MDQTILRFEEDAKAGYAVGIKIKQMQFKNEKKSMIRLRNIYVSNYGVFITEENNKKIIIKKKKLFQPGFEP